MASVVGESRAILGVVPWIVVEGLDKHYWNRRDRWEDEGRGENRVGGGGLKGIYIQPCVLDSDFFVTPTIIYLHFT